VVGRQQAPLPEEGSNGILEVHVRAHDFVYDCRGAYLIAIPVSVVAAGPANILEQIRRQFRYRCGRSTFCTAPPGAIQEAGIMSPNSD
ncbi:MAG: hypothetical protein AAF362_20885, partial [Pseudomonadota bacterium]